MGEWSRSGKVMEESWLRLESWTGNERKTRKERHEGGWRERELGNFCMPNHIVFVSN